MSAEFDFLCRAISGRGPDEVSAPSPRNIDWMRVAQLAERHSVRPKLLVAWSDWEAVPAEVKHSLNEFQQSHPVRCLQFAAELLDIADLFEKRHVRFATFKGPALSAMLYGDVAQREYNDIDILVHESDLANAEACLHALGYRAKFGEKTYRDTFQGYQNQSIFQKDDLMIDLHWDFSTKGIPFPIRARDIWDNLELVPVAGRNIPTLGRHAHAVFLAGHGTKEGWKSLSWVSDLADFLRAYPEIDWMGLWRRANQNNCGRPILLGCLLASRLFDAPVNKDLLARADREPAVRALAEAAIKRMTELPDVAAPGGEEFLLGLDLCETRLQKAMVLWRLASTRTTSDYQSMPLPRALWRLYHVTRPFRLGMKILFEGRPHLP